MPFRVRSILAASDLSGGEAAVLQSASGLAALAESELHVIHAVEADGASGGEGPRMEDRLRSAGDALREQLESAVPARTQVTSSRAWPGRAHQVILRRAEDVGADLIVIGPHRREGQRQVLGTTADRVVRTSKVPCMIIRGPMSLPLRRVLVPSDFSPAAAGALDLALIWATALRLPTSSGGRTRLDVQHVLPSEAGGPTGSSDRTATTALREQVQAACRRTECGAALELVESVVEGGSAAEAILRTVRERDIDLLVMGTHGEAEQERALIGSVSSAVARRATCPVLLCPPELAQELSAREPAHDAGARQKS